VLWIAQLVEHLTVVYWTSGCRWFDSCSGDSFLLFYVERDKNCFFLCLNITWDIQVCKCFSKKK
jgi:hypothetical protein